MQPTDAMVIERTQVVRHCGCGMQDRRFCMLMFKRSQLYIGFALAALAELIVRAAVR